MTAAQDKAAWKRAERKAGIAAELAEKISQMVWQYAHDVAGVAAFDAEEGFSTDDAGVMHYRKLDGDDLADVRDAEQLLLELLIREFLPRQQTAIGRWQAAAGDTEAAERYPIPENWRGERFLPQRPEWQQKAGQ